MRDIAWAIVVLAGAVIVAAGVIASDHRRGEKALLVGGCVGTVALVRLACFRGSSHPDHRDG